MLESASGAQDEAAVVYAAAGLMRRPDVGVSFGDRLLREVGSHLTWTSKLRTDTAPTPVVKQPPIESHCDDGTVENLPPASGKV